MHHLCVCVCVCVISSSPLPFILFFFIFFCIHPVRWCPALTYKLVRVQVQEGPGARKVQFELTQETLQAMLDGLGKIRDQLNAVNASGTPKQ